MRIVVSVIVGGGLPFPFFKSSVKFEFYVGRQPLTSSFRAF